MSWVAGMGFPWPDEVFKGRGGMMSEFITRDLYDIPELTIYRWPMLFMVDPGPYVAYWGA